MGLREGAGALYFKDDKEKDAAPPPAWHEATSNGVPITGAPIEPNSGSGVSQPGAALAKRQPSLSGTAKDPLLSNRKLAFITATPPPNIHVEMLMD